MCRKGVFVCGGGVGGGSARGAKIKMNIMLWSLYSTINKNPLTADCDINQDYDVACLFTLKAYHLDIKKTHIWPSIFHRPKYVQHIECRIMTNCVYIIYCNQ